MATEIMKQLMPKHVTDSSYLWCSR